MTRNRESLRLQRDLAAAAAAGGARGDGSRLELLEVLEHADHRVARCGMRLVRDRSAEADAQLGAELRLDEAVGTERLLGIVVSQIGFAAGGGNPDRGESFRKPFRKFSTRAAVSAPGAPFGWAGWFSSSKEV